MSRAQAQQLSAARLEEDGSGSENSRRFASLQLAVYAQDDDGANTDELLIEAGGKWDRRLKEFTGDAELKRILGVHADQVPVVKWFLCWLNDYLSDIELDPEEIDYSALLGGGQRSGKTWVGVLLGIIFALCIPGSIVWVVTPDQNRFEEIQDLIENIMPRSWFSRLGSPWWRYSLPNGSKIVLRSAHDPGDLKNGDADFIVINEAQQISEKAFAICRARIAAASGMCIVCANPPEKPIGQWVGDFAVEAQEGLRQAKFFHIDPMSNPHIDKRPLVALAKELDKRTFDETVRGLFLGAKNAVWGDWSRTANEKVPPEDLDITPRVTKFFEGREFDSVIGVDVQYSPMASVEYKFFENPAALGQKERTKNMWCHMWAVSSLCLHGADEAALAAAWLEAGLDPDRTLIVCDASGSWQFAERNPLKVRKLREEVKGRGSFAVFRSMGFKYVVKPDRDSERNPDIIERCRVTAGRICTAMPGPYGQRFLYSDPRNKSLNKAIRQWPNRSGKPHRNSPYAHEADAFSYPVIRFFPRREIRDPKVKVVRRPKRKKRMRGW